MRTVSLADIELAVEERGSGPVLLFVHGFPLDHTMWRWQIDDFSARYRVLAPDLRGFGKSALGDEKMVTMRRYADDLAAMLDRLGVHEKIVFIGLSMGGYIAWQFWQKYAGRLAGLVLCDTRAVADAPSAKVGRAELAARVRTEGPQAAADAMLPKLFSPQTPSPLARPELVEGTGEGRGEGEAHKQSAAPCSSTSPVADTRAAILRNSLLGIAAALAGMAERPDVTEVLGGIAVPTLAIVGEHDAISTPAEMRDIADCIPGAQFAVIPHAGHMSPLENPQAFNAALTGFLASIGY
jgi:pimeloyl-ACP methyl ester carboxylesterase